MEVPRGFTRCDECEGSGGIDHGGGIDPWNGPRDVELCRPCSGSGLLPTEKLREEAIASLDFSSLNVRIGEGACLRSIDERRYVADAVLRKVAEHIGEER